MNNFQIHLHSVGVLYFCLIYYAIVLRHILLNQSCPHSPPVSNMRIERKHFGRENAFVPFAQILSMPHFEYNSVFRFKRKLILKEIAIFMTPIFMGIQAEVKKTTQ